MAAGHAPAFGRGLQTHVYVACPRAGKDLLEPAAPCSGACTASVRARPAGPPGALFESLVTQSLRVYAQAAEATVNHLRTWGGELEVDLIVVRGDQRVVAVEVKLAATAGDRDARALCRLRDRIGPQLLDAAIVTTGADAYRRRDGIAVIPASLLGP